MELFEAPPIYTRIIHEDLEKNFQIRLVVNPFRGIEYLHLRKYYQDFDEEWKPTPEGLAFPITIENSKELFSGLVEILSLAESKEILEEHFKEELDIIYCSEEK